MKVRLKSGATPMDVAYIKRRTSEGATAEDISRECHVELKVVQAFAESASAAGEDETGKTEGHASPPEAPKPSVKRRRRSTN